MTGRKPFEADEWHAVVLKIMNDPPAAAHEVRASIPAGCSKVLHKALAKDREQRYATCIDFVDALEDELPPPAPPLPPLPPTPPIQVEEKIAEALKRIEAKEGGSMGSFYIVDQNLRRTYGELVRFRDALGPDGGALIREALTKYVDSDIEAADIEKAMTKWKAMHLLALFGEADVTIYRRYAETQQRWIPRQLLFQFLHTIRLPERVGLLSEIARFDDSSSIRSEALRELTKHGPNDFPEALRPAVEDGLRDPVERVRSEAVSAAACGDPAWAAKIARDRLAQENSLSVCVAAACALGKSGVVKDILPLADAFLRNRINPYVVGEVTKELIRRFGLEVVTIEINRVSAANARDIMLKAAAQP